MCFGFILLCSLSLSHSQRTKGQRYRFSLLLKELKEAETEEYVACVLAFINCIIAGAPSVSARVRLRNELIGKYVHILCEELYKFCIS